MDCCSNESTREESKANLKGGKMDKRILLWIIIAILVLAVIYVVFFKDTGSVSAAAGSASSAAQSYGGMVGGC